MSEKKDQMRSTAHDAIESVLTEFADANGHKKLDNEMTNDVIQTKIQELLDIVESYE